MFREDFEFSDANGPSHHAAHQPTAVQKEIGPEETLSKGSSSNVIWMTDAEKELRKIPFFVRGKAKRNTERYAVDHGVIEISIDTLYEAKPIMLDSHLHNAWNEISYRISIITLDSHNAMPCERALSNLVGDFKGLDVSIFAAAEWGENPSALEAVSYTHLTLPTILRV